MISKRFFKTKDDVEVTFEVDRPDLNQVEWVSEAMDWKPMLMKRADRGKGPFRTKVRLPRDHRIQFRYLFDGHRWENDEAADEYWPNEHGSHNSVVSTAPEPA